METNTIAFIGLCNEYCQHVEGAREAEREDFIDAMLRVSPRIYISAFDIKPDRYLDEDVYLDQALDEDYYDAVRRNMEQLIGADDTYLDVFEEDMKYSDTPVAFSISEKLADLFQVFYNFISTVRDATDENVALALQGVAEEFRGYWSKELCSVFRALNNLKFRD